MVIEEFGKSLRNLVHKKNSLAAQKLITEHHRCVPEIISTTYALALTAILKDIPGLWFQLRLASGLFLTLELAFMRINLTTLQYCPFFCRNLNITTNVSSLFVDHPKNYLNSQKITP
jgi:hypothetical protein